MNRNPDPLEPTNMSDQVFIQKRTSYAVVIIVFSFFACTLVSLRLWSRRIKGLALSLSDYMITLGLVSTPNPSRMEHSY